MSKKTTELPQGWEVSNVGEVCQQIVSGSGFPKQYQGKTSGTYPFAKVGDISRVFRAGIEKISSADHFIDEEIRQAVKAKIFPSGSIVFAKIGEALKNNYRVITAREMLFDNNVMGITPNLELIETKYLYYRLLTEDFGRFSVATAVPSIRRGDVEAIQIFLPPLNEQKRIVAKIEALFSELDKGIESLKTAREQLKIYRQAVLKHAFEGKLTADWREENKDKLEPADELLARIQKVRETQYQQQLKDWQAAVEQWEVSGKEGKKPSKPRKAQEADKPSPDHISRMWDLPDGWQWLQVGSFAFVTKLAGFEYTKFVRYDENGDLPVIKAENAGPHGYRATEYSLVKSETVSHLSRSHLNGGELLVVFVGAGTGNVATAPSDQNYFLGPNIGMVRTDSEIISTKYLELFLRSPKGKDLMLAAMKAVAQPSISMGTIRQCPIAVPSTDEQKQIILKLEQVLSEVERTESDIDEQLQKAEALRQSILKKAFSGQLVAQDPKDEPASVLLERIREEKAVEKKSKKKTSKNKEAA